VKCVAGTTQPTESHQCSMLVFSRLQKTTNFPTIISQILAKAVGPPRPIVEDRIGYQSCGHSGDVQRP
jgi:hypothetical protein